jgi:hypothetical protein
MADTHPFTPAADPGWILVCRCGKWPGHHVHTGDVAACTCDACCRARRKARRKDTSQQVAREANYG